MMAKYNEILVGRFNNFLKRVFGMKGEAPAPQLSSEIVVSHPLFHGAENRYGESWNRFSTSSVLTGNAGQISAFRLVNPSTSKVIAVIEKLAVGSSTAQEIDFGLVQNTGDPSFTSFASVPLDTRQSSVQGGNTGFASQSACVASFIGSGAGTPGIVFGRARVPVSQMYESIVTENQEVPLNPHSTLNVQNTVAATDLIVWIMWRERVIEDSEVN